MGEVVHFSPPPKCLRIVCDAAPSRDIVSACIIPPAPPPITREHQLESALMIAEAQLHRIARGLDIEPESWPAHIPQSVVDAINRALTCIDLVKSK